MNIHRNLVAFKTILTREILRFMRIWIQTVMPPAINALLYLVVFGTLIGSQVREVDGYRYMDYIVPGIIMLSVIMNSYSNVVSSFYAAKFQHFVEEMLISPVHNVVILAGFVAGGVARGLVVGAAVTAIALLFTDLQVVNVWITLSVVLLTAILFSIGGFINAIYANSFDDISIVPNFILMPLIYLGGIFYSIQLLPPVWQLVSKINPILYMVNGFRYGILGVSDISIAYAFGIILAFIFALGGFALYLLNRGVGLKQ
ncbi:MAG TPA: ABC transporter permease [Gammaproteobacteria bacterium]|nr:ABC transporter permease [Gammaproteobacteria bacterium]